ncbi:hypothetical protein VPH219E481_0021 [Vibrio phage 219E48-1]
MGIIGLVAFITCLVINANDVKYQTMVKKIAKEDEDRELARLKRIRMNDPDWTNEDEEKHSH